MSEIRINILDRNLAVNGTLHGSLADAILAGLAAEPETIGELEDAMVRFAKPAGSRRHLAGLLEGVNELVQLLIIVMFSRGETLRLLLGLISIGTGR
jgi:hypothetical protein